MRSQDFRFRKYGSKHESSGTNVADLRDGLLGDEMSVVISGVHEFDSRFAIGGHGRCRIYIEERGDEFPSIVLEDPDFELFKMRHGRQPEVGGRSLEPKSERKLPP
jgi:hypothetical protein